MPEEQPNQTIPHKRVSIETNPATRALSSPDRRYTWHQKQFPFALFLAVTSCAGLPLRSPSSALEDPRVKYALATPDNVISRLQHQIDSGQVILAYDTKRGYLPAVLKALRIPASSQLLVFSKTSIQKELISPHSPRALYFNQDSYIGFLPESKSLEVVAFDPKVGPVYYVLLQKPKERPQFFRTVDACLECHATRSTNYIPEHLMRSVFTDKEGTPYTNVKSYLTTDQSPFGERWGGWYVTGRLGIQRHMGNSFADRQGDEVSLNREKGANLTDLHELVDTTPYLSPHSDIVALMILAHQTHLQNLITQANYQTKAALGIEINTDRAASLSWNELTDFSRKRIKEACEPLVKALLFEGETPINSPITGTSSFAHEFIADGPYDRKKRTLRQLDLKSRLFHYRCSYLIYSEAYDALPGAAKDYVYRRLSEILSGRDKSKEFAYLPSVERQAILGILIATKPTFAHWSKRR